MNAQTVIVADDHPLFRSALVLALRGLLPDATLHEVDAFDALQRTVESGIDADLVLLDLHMPGARGFSSLLYLRNEHPALPVVIVSGHEEPAIMQRAFDFGASGYIPKSSGLPTLALALRAVLDGEIWQPPQLKEAPAQALEHRELAQRIASLSPQQFRVFMMLAEGRLNKQIAYDIDVTEATVKAHVTAILRKLGLVRRTQAALLAQRLLQAENAALEVPAAEGLPVGEDDDA
ncbi:response regulator transcription factor [Sinimarinibacterium sp. CAU 1509]|uniref:response regulator n=1 Tax=Sinimarinibacterium sp. CAU 1509 TaxID=2562283 RepID=UPI0010AB598C|nr:response regulator transcription factor [Sinimarinibacterium sp. CAU 1509]TJY58996.1 response regulator transcription factor [Sinimarinibacterium sp. CAU 1509]